MENSFYTWDRQFLDLFERCLKEYQSGNTDFTTYYEEEDLAFLGSIGYKEREFFDFVEDYGDRGDPVPQTALLVAAARRDYFIHRMGGEPGDREITPDELPDKSEELDGVVWLPRIIIKAQGKLRGELDPDIMFCCGGDRKFLRTHDIHPADFLRTVWSAESSSDPTAAIAEYVKSVSKA